ncbi:hypothetical protein HELRODRAFT_171912 [Helobdella robusta]|uniref:Apple domain-containing protein n=1 Tax=Helobdella robusta TaxID=6412 RepID=T1F4U3_HELRO|nr:hypothetical protein HELRODRAFT_171912 [Helobdella robusta]ESO04910.1 hypothetical protein HELRODRAFT_171912 [Helobdella robusta]
MNQLKLLMAIAQIQFSVANINCFQKFEEDSVSFCSCDPAIEDRSWSTFSFLEALMLCSMRCSQTASCVAYNFFNATNQCQLFNQTLNKFSVLSGCQYYLRNGGAELNRPLLITADDELQEFFFNGENISLSYFPNAKNWSQLDTFNMPSEPFVIALKAYNMLFNGGMIAKTPDGYILTNETWKCTTKYYEGWHKISYNDSFWPAGSYSKKLNDTDWLSDPYLVSIFSGADWITNVTACKKCAIYCRKNFIDKEHTK